MYFGDRQPARSVAFAATRSSGTPREKQFPSSKNRNMRKRNITLLTAIAAAAAFASSAQAALTILVDEDTVNNEIHFTWEGVIGTATTAGGTSGGSADQIVPEDGQVQFANGHVNFDSGEWYAGTASAYGDGGSFSDFIVSSNIPFHVNPDGTLRVGKIGGDVGSTFPTLGSTVFSGSFTLDGLDAPGATIAGFGLFNTAATSLTTNESVSLWTATTGTGSISFAAIPEPSAALLLGVAGMGLLVRRRRA